MNRVFDRRLLIGIGLVAVLMIVNVVVGCRNVLLLYDVDQRVAQSYRVLAAAQQLLTAIQDSETGQRGYLITGNEAYLAPYETGLASIQKDLDNLTRLTADNSQQQAHIELLRTHLREKLAELQHTIDLRKEQGFEAAREVVVSDVGREAMQRIRDEVAQMEDDERVLLDRRAATAHESRTLAIATGALTGVLGLFMVGVFVFLLERHLQGQARAAAQLHERSEWLRTTLTSIGDAVVTTDATGRVTMLNPIAQSLTGWTEADAQGQPLDAVFKIINEYSRQPVENPVTKVLREGRVVGLANHTLLLAKNGVEYPIDDSAAPIKDSRGGLLGVVLIFRDVGEQRHAANALQDREQRLRLALDAGHMGTWEWNLKTDEVLWSPGIEKLHGAPAGSFPGTFEAYHRDMHPEDRERVLDSLRSAARGEGEHHIEYRLLWDDGSVHWIEARARLFRDESGQPQRMIGICTDIAERKRVEQSLRFLARASAVLSTVIDYDSTLQRVVSLAVPDFADWCAMRIVDVTGKLEPLAAAHVDPDKVELARQLADRYPMKQEQPWGPARVLRTGKAEMATEIDEGMLAALAGDGDHLALLKRLGLKSYLSVPLKSHDRLLGVISFGTAESGRRYSTADLAVAEDLANRAAVCIENARLYRDLRTADQRKDEFLAMLAHELRNPLAPIRNALELLTPETDRASAEWARNLIQRQVQHIVRLVDDLLDVSRIMRGKIQLKKEPVELAVAIRHAVEEAKPALESQEQQFTLTLPPEPLWVQADPNRLSQVVSNLLNNAAKYTDRKGCISLDVQRDDGCVRITVNDTGVGIERPMLERIFEPFTQITDSLDRSRGGLGIGLALVKKLVELHGGSVVAHSEGLGRGSEFTVRLPVSTRPNGPQPVEWSPSPVPRRKILVVDDNVGSAQTLARLLTKFWGHDVEVAYDGSSALDKITSFRPQLVLLDIGLPGLSGYDVAARVRASRENDSMLLVALTGYGQDTDRQRSAAAGFDEHMVKPASAMALQELFGHPKLKQAG